MSYSGLFKEVISPPCAFCGSYSFFIFMGFMRIWMGTLWGCSREVFSCNLLAKKREKCYLSCLLLWDFGFWYKGTHGIYKYVKKDVQSSFLIMSCDMSYEHNCDLCSELPRVTMRSPDFSSK